MTYRRAFMMKKRVDDMEFGKMERGEIKAAVELASRAFDDYVYFTNYFPDDEERRKVMRAIIYREYITNYGRTHFLTAKIDGKLVATAQLDAPGYKRASDISYLLHGWLRIYKGVDRQKVDDWLAMDHTAGKPCHDYQKTGPDIWYASSLTVEPSAQGTGIGTRFITYWEEYVRALGGKQLVLFTNSQKNIDYYRRHGFEVFHETEIVYEGKKMGSWSVKKVL